MSFRVHHQTGIAALFLIVLHVFGTTLPFLSLDTQAAIDFLVDLRDPVLATGWLALTFTIVGIAISYLKRIRYSVWRWIHRTLIFSFLVSLIHFWIGTGPLRASELFTLTLSLAAGLVLLLNYFYPRSLRKTSRYKITETKNMGDHTVEISMVPESSEMIFSPGQFAYLSVDCTQGCGVSHEYHPYTLDSDPIDKKLRIAVKALGDDSAKLQHVLPGNTAALEGPYGNLIGKLEPHIPQLWIAGGIGVTPFISYLRHRLKHGYVEPSIHLILLLKNSDENIFSTELSNVGGVKVVIHLDDQDGSPNLKNLLPNDWRQRSFIITGAAKMVKSFKRDLQKMGIDEIKTEEFEF